ncbi:putative septin-11 [Apostichopus japonicus]|uniref:Putative septin-11 n=1 Tax=Stichopus japonicus TaxID=307972 RepID=A0A2G8LLN4_STIJA|nr:putative septin-11 [Apostichopus japonicus]
MGFVDNSPDNKPLSLQETYAVKRQEHQSSLQKKEDEMRQLFVLKVKDKEGQLKTMEKDLHEKFDKLKKDHAEEKKRLDDEKRRLDDEMDQFNQKRKQFNEEMATLPAKTRKVDRIIFVFFY